MPLWVANISAPSKSGRLSQGKTLQMPATARDLLQLAGYKRMTRRGHRNALYLTTAFLPTLASAEAFNNEANWSWADTPRGRFECRSESGSKGIETLSFAGKVLFKGRLMGLATWDGTLANGIYNANTGCPYIVDSKNGFIVISRQTQPPSYGISGYAIIDTNSDPITVEELVESQATSRAQQRDQLVWGKNDLTLSYYGYPVGTYGGSINSPKPAFRKVRYDFKTGAVAQMK